jgi:hypothetical protein
LPVVAGFPSGPQAFLSVIATLPAAEQQDSPSPPLPAQQEDLPSAIVEQEPSLPPQQPFSPGLVAHDMPAAEHLHPSLVPPTSAVALAWALVVFSSTFGVVVDEVVLLALLAAFVEFDELPVLLAPPQPARPRTITARNAASFIFIDVLLLLSRKRVSKPHRMSGQNERNGCPESIIA